jgi:hypothetical protein
VAPSADAARNSHRITPDVVVPDPHHGEELMAWVIREDSALSEEEMRTLCRSASRTTSARSCLVDAAR